MAARAGLGSRTQLSDDAASYVRSQILSGELRPGDSVRVEALASALEISSTPAREALQALRVEGFLELLPRRGFVVAPLGPSDIRDLFAAYSLLSGELVARAASVITDAQVDALDQLHRKLLAAAERGDAALLEECNFEFHQQLDLIAGAPKIQWVLGLIERYIPHFPYASIAGWPQATVEDHPAILMAVKNRDPEGARSAMTRHLTHAGELLAQQFQAIDAQRLAAANATRAAVGR